MKNILKLLLLSLLTILIVSCGNNNHAEGKINFYNTVSHGQQLSDLKKALNENAITRAEYDTLKTKIMNNVIDIPKYIDEIDEDNDKP